MKIKLKKILSYYDIPLTFIAEDKEQNQYICEIISDDNNLEYWCLPIKDTELKNILQGKKNLKDFFLEHKKELFRGIFTNLDLFNEITPIPENEVDEDWCSKGECFNCYSKQEDENE